MLNPNASNSETTTPILPIGITLLYFDQRIRKEAFDIEMMMEKEAT